MRNFKRFSLIALLALLSFSGCERGDVVALADGGQVPFDHWEGRWLIINYWAEWCAPCRKEIPELNLLHSERSRTGAVVLGVNYDALTGDTLTSLIDEMEIEFPVLLEDPRERWGVEQPAVLPSTIIVKPNGELSQVLVGPQHYEDLIQAIGAQPGG
jgi:thiol-disulfide isomerase/thioredoxin